MSKENLSKAIKRAFINRVLCSRDTILYQEEFNDAIDKIAIWLLSGNNYKNLMLYGGVGIGKTTCLWSIAEVLATTRAFGYVHFFSANSIVNENFINGDGWRLINNSPLALIDDVGTESSDIKIYGSLLCPMKTVLENRYLHKRPTIITSNLSLDMFGDKYGERVMDRMKEYDTIVLDINESLR